MHCPDAPRCRFTTTQPHRMEHHKKVSGHGTKAKEFRGYLSTGGGQKKGKNETTGGGQKKGKK
jgi:hypothetical protein